MSLPIENSDCNSSLVTIANSGKGVGLCLDNKCRVNQRLVSVNHPLHRIEDFLNNILNIS